MRDFNDEDGHDEDEDGSDDEDDEDEDGQPARKKRRWFGPRGPGTGTKRGPRKAAPMAPDVAKRMGEANSYWMAGDFDRAVEFPPGIPGQCQTACDKENRCAVDDT